MATRRSTRARSESQEADVEVTHSASRTRTTRSRVSRVSTQHRSIAETEVETDTGAEDVDASNSPSSDSSSEESNPHRNRYFSSTGFTRSPYLTRSSSKTRSAVKAYQSTHYISSPTKTLSFNEEEEDRNDSSARRHSHRHAPATPGEIDAHDDAEVYLQDCCDSHEVKLPDGSVLYRKHTHRGHSHTHTRTPSRNLTSPSPAAAASSARKSVSAWWILLGLILVSLAGPFVLKHFTHKPPAFVVQDGQKGGIITQADLDQIIKHVVETVRGDLKNGQYVTEPRLQTVTSDLSDRLTAARNQYVEKSVATTVQDLTSKLDAAIQAENAEDAKTLAAAKAEIIALIESRTAQVSKDWESRLNKALLLENDEDAATLKKQFESIRAEFQSLLASQLDSRFVKWEEQIREKLMKEAAENFAPLSAVLSNDAATQAAQAAKLNEDRVLKTLKKYVDEVIAALPKPEAATPVAAAEIDEAALEKRLLDKVSISVTESVTLTVSQSLTKDLSALQASVSKDIDDSVSKSVDAATKGAVDSLSQSITDSVTDSVAASVSQSVIDQVSKSLDDRLAKESKSFDDRLTKESTRLRSELDSADSLSKLGKRVEQLQQEMQSLSVAANAPVPVDLDSIRKEIAAALERYSADRTEKVDYALRSSGGRVLAQSPSHMVPMEGNLLTKFLSKCFVNVRKADELLNDNMSVGSCWPMDGTNGFVSIGLRQKITPTAVSLQHIAASIAPDHSTTPKDFTVWGVDEDDYDRLKQHTNSAPVGVNLGRFTYVANSTQLQTFELRHPQPASPKQYNILTIGFQSNQGNPSYTCIYRVRVHGHP